MTKKELCKKVMSELFGPASARLVDSMSEDECVAICRKKVESFYGIEKAKSLFDNK